MNARRRRGATPELHRYRVTPRDLELVAAVGRMAEATTDQLRRLFFKDPSTASRRLAKLVALRLLNVHVGALEEPNRYTLGPRANDRLEMAGISTSALHHRRGGRGIDPHLRTLNDLRVDLVRAVRGRSDVALHAFHGDLDLRRAAGAVSPPYIPDAVVELSIGTTELVLMVEIDLGTEGLTVFAPKVTFTVTLWRGGARCWGALPGTWRPVVFVPSATRARALARAIIGADGGVLWLIAELDKVRERGVLGPIFATAADVASTPRGDAIRYTGALAPAALTDTAPEARP